MVNKWPDEVLTQPYKELILQLATYFVAHEVNITVQFLKIQEELGEVAEAWIGCLGLNPRKGFTHNFEDVVMELADVANTAIIAIQMMGFEPDNILRMQAAKAEERMRDTP
jgi:NTP pyrophosphatase (non-canonical NTP hydrolase)